MSDINFNQFDKKDFIKTSLTLFVLTLVAALCLGLTNIFTQTKIEQNIMSEREADMRKIIADADDFTKVSDYSPQPQSLVREIYTAKKEGEVIGYAVMSEVQGFSGALSLVVGIDTAGAVIGYEVMQSTETPGLGSKVAEEPFKSRFTGKNDILKLTKSPAPGTSEISAISGATISSKAVLDGVNAAIEAVKAQINP